MADNGAGAAPGYSAWRVAFLPTFALLGFALPITFLTAVEQYLYYLRPLELIPTYGTAWLFLGVLCIPLSLLFGLVLDFLDGPRGSQRVRTGLVVLLTGIAAAALLAALANGVVVWLRTFGLLSRVHVLTSLSICSVAAGIFIGITPAGRAALLKLYSRSKWLTALGALTLLCLPFSGWNTGALALPTEHLVGAATVSSRPNILLVTIDTLSAEHMSLYGAARTTSPSLDAFAREATVFDRAYANGNFTTPGIASILTGTRPWTNRALQLQAWSIADARRNSLPALLKRAGYQTAYVATSPWAGAARNGLAGYFNFAATDAMTNLTACREGWTAVLPYDCAATQLAPFVFAGAVMERAREIAFDKPPNWHFDPRLAIRAALEWIGKTDKRKPIFLWVHLLPPHSPYAAPQPWLGKFDSSMTARSVADSDSEAAYLFGNIGKEQAHVLEARYDESISYVDYFVGEFLSQSLQQLGDNTAVILTADHGESFAHGYGMHTGPGLYESIIRIPLVIKAPHQTQGMRTSIVTEQIDVAPTIAELAGLAPSSTWEGRSLAPTRDSWPTEASMPVKPVFAMNFEENPRRSVLTTGSVAVVEGQWKFVKYMGTLHYRMMPPLHDELYDLATDPNELANRISDYPDEAERLRGLIAVQLELHGSALP
jgi:arylsulfatase A-like enzyme